MGQPTQVEGSLENKKNFYIGGKWVESKNKEEIKVINPATEDVCAEISLGSKEDTNMAVIGIQIEDGAKSNLLIIGIMNGIARKIQQNGTFMVEMLIRGFCIIGQNMSRDQLVFCIQVR